VIVGSSIVQRIEELGDTPELVPERIGAFVGELRAAIEAAVKV
jgi:tryptophan synthase alpha subunit